jgi:hypothetical protein
MTWSKRSDPTVHIPKILELSPGIGFVRGHGMEGVDHGPCNRLTRERWRHGSAGDTGGQEQEALELLDRLAKKRRPPVKTDDPTRQGCLRNGTGAL